MSAQASSIQSYFQRENCNPGTGMQRNTTAGGDSTSSAKGPTPSEKWQPRSQYTEKQIRDLKVGPGNVSVTGRVVNFYEQTSRGKSPLAAKGSLKIVVKDDSGAITVKLWYANKIYALKLGDLVTIWTHHISNPENSSPTIQHASLVTSMFPERDNTSYFQIQGNVPGYSGKTPLGYRFGFPMPGLVTLKNFIDGAHEVTNMSILVCVRSIGVMKNFTNKKGQPIQNISVHLFDHTASITLTLWGSLVASTTAWKPSSTVLMITNPDFRGDHKPTIGLRNETCVEVDPLMFDATWLEDYAQKLAKHECVNPPFPQGVFDLNAIFASPQRAFFTGEQLSNWVRIAPDQKITGYLVVRLMELNMDSLHKQKRLLCAECCGIPLYSSSTSRLQCSHCFNIVALRPNPKILGRVIDESGALDASGMIFSPAAWLQLFGRDAEGLIEAWSGRGEVGRYLESRLL